MIKFVYLVKRVEGMTFEEFVEYHRERHAPLFTSIPEAQRYVKKYAISHPVPAAGYPEPEYDGLTEIWFESWADHDAFFTSANYRELVQPDEPEFIVLGAGATLVTQERVVVQPAGEDGFRPPGLPGHAGTAERVATDDRG